MHRHRARYPTAPFLTLKKRPLFIALNYRRYRPTRTARHRQTLQHPMLEAANNEIYFSSR